jgi:Putative adhesin
MRNAFLGLTPRRVAGKFFGVFFARSLARLPVVSVLLIFAALSASSYAFGWRDGNQKQDSYRSGPRLKSDERGEFPTRDGRRLHLVLDLGNIVVHTQNSDKVDYTIHLETDASQKDAKELLKGFSVSGHETSDGVYLRGQTSRLSSGRLWVTVTINVPKSYTLELSTGGGNIDSDDIDGPETVLTSGGNIKAGNVAGRARLVTGGGHITVKNVSGGLFADTGGGHITTGTVTGGAILHTSGGHIRMASVDGMAKLSTGGGNVTVEHSGSELNAETSGGQIEVGETTGLVRARTGGGGIRVVRVSGPTDLETVGGSIYLTQVDSAVKASTGAGIITAWFVSPPKSPSQCQLQSNDGDIVVYIPRQMPVTIDAQVQLGDEHRVIVDPAFQLKMTYDSASNGGHLARAEGPLNGGGEILHLRTVTGNIRLVASDAGKQVLLYKQQMAQLEEKIRSQLVEQSQSHESAP